MITFETESWDAIRDEIAPLWRLHYEEIASDRDRIPLAPDYVKYQRYSDCGQLHITVAREGGRMVGYAFALVDTALHYATTLCGFYDLYWLEPERRKGMAGIMLLKETEKALKARGVRKIFTGTKVWKDVGPLFERMGWQETERLFTKWVGD